MFEVFWELTPINANATESEIILWKKNGIVEQCHQKLFKKMNRDDTYMSQIINRTWKKNKKKATKVQIAFAMSICDTLFNPSNKHVQISEEILKEKLRKNLVSFCNFIIELKIFSIN